VPPVVRTRVGRVPGVERLGQPVGDPGSRGPAGAVLVEQQSRGDDAAGRGEDRRRPGVRASLVDGQHLAAHTVELLGHLVSGAEPVPGVGVGGPQRQPVQRLVPLQQRVVVGHLGRDPAARGLDTQRQHRQRAADRVEIRGRGELAADDLRGVVADGAVDDRVGVVDPGHGTHVDQREVALALHDVVGLEVAVDVPRGVQVAERGQHLDHVGERVGDGQRAVAGAGVAHLRERGPADVGHHDVVGGGTVVVDVPDEVVDRDDVGVAELGQELPLGPGGGQRGGVVRVEDALEHHPAVVDVAVDGEVDPAEAAVGQRAAHLVLAGDQRPLGQGRGERVRRAVLRAEAAQQAGAALPAAADRVGRAAVPAVAVALRDLGVAQERAGRVDPRHRRDVVGAAAAAHRRGAGRAGGQRPAPPAAGTGRDGRRPGPCREGGGLGVPGGGPPVGGGAVPRVRDGCGRRAVPRAGGSGGALRSGPRQWCGRRRSVRWRRVPADVAEAVGLDHPGAAVPRAGFVVGRPRRHGHAGLPPRRGHPFTRSW
jgi:hypothetical protein